MPLLMNSAHVEIVDGSDRSNSEGGILSEKVSALGEGEIREPKKKKPTPNNSDNSAAAAGQPCQGQ